MNEEKNENPQVNFTVLTLGVVLFCVLLIGGFAFFMLYEKSNKETPTTANKNTNTLPVISPGNYQYKLYTCPNAFSEAIEDCFIPANRVYSSDDINIHGSATSTGYRDFVSLFVVFEDCSACDKPKYLDFDTATKSGTECTVSASIDLNDFGIYNQTIFPTEEPYDHVTLRAKDHVRMDVRQYSYDVDSYMITPNPAGCDLIIRSFQAL